MTFLTNKALTRRTLLKGMGASVALPLLDSMMPALSAQSKQAPMPFNIVRRVSAFLVRNVMRSPCRYWGALLGALRAILLWNGTLLATPSTSEPNV